MTVQHSFWGWGKEDNNMVRRLQLHGMWPPERPSVPKLAAKVRLLRDACNPEIPRWQEQLNHPQGDLVFAVPYGPLF